MCDFLGLCIITNQSLCSPDQQVPVSYQNRTAQKNHETASSHKSPVSTAAQDRSWFRARSSSLPLLSSALKTASRLKPISASRRTVLSLTVELGAEADGATASYAGGGGTGVAKVGKGGATEEDCEGEAGDFIETGAFGVPAGGW